VILRGDAWKARRIQNNCLRQHCHALATTFRRHEFMSLRAVCSRVFLSLETRSSVLTEIHPTELAVVACVRSTRRLCRPVAAATGGLAAGS
jgi:hypothetical protein